MERQNKETLWSNVGKLRTILLHQFWPLVAFILILAVIIPFWNLFQIYIEVTASPDPWYLHICNGGVWYMLSLGIAIFICSYDILSKNEISMFPGTVFSRYLGTVEAIHIIILMSTLGSACSYLLQGIIVKIVCSIRGDLILGDAFQISYLCYGALRHLGILLALYAVGVLWYVLMERFGSRIMYLLTLVAALVFLALAKAGFMDAVIQTASYLFRGEGYSFGMLMGILLGVWAVCMTAATILAATVRSWHAADNKRMGVAIIWAYVLFIGLIVIGLEWEYSFSMDPQVFQQETDHRIETAVDVSAALKENKGPSLDLLDYMMAVKYHKNKEMSETSYVDVLGSVYCTVSEAKEYGLSFDESKLDQNHVILLLGSRNLTFAGKDLGVDALKAYQDSTKLVKDRMDEIVQEEDEDFPPSYYYQTEIPQNQMIVINALYGDLGNYMKDTTLDNDNGFRTVDSVMERMLRIVIYPDEWNLELDY